MLDKKIIAYLKELSKNNNREWFHLHKPEYEAAVKSLETFSIQLIAGIQKFDKELGVVTFKESLFRIYKDIRFSKDKTPYKTNMGIYLAKGGRKSGNAGYYLHIEPGGCFLAGGIYMPDSESLKLLRKEIFYNIDEFEKIIHDKKFKQFFGEIMGEKLVNAPKDFPSDFKQVELLKYKSYAVIHHVTDKMMFAESFADHAIEVYKAMLPINKFLNRARH